MFTLSIYIFLKFFMPKNNFLFLHTFIIILFNTIRFCLGQRFIYSYFGFFKKYKTNCYHYYKILYYIIINGFMFFFIFLFTIVFI